MPSLSMRIRQKTYLNTEKLERGEYNWLDLGRVGYGIRNDEGSVHIHMKIGILKGNIPNYPNMIVDVIEKYHGAAHGIDFNTIHKTEKVIFHKPNNLHDLIKKFSGEDKRSFKEE